MQIYPYKWFPRNRLCETNIVRHHWRFAFTPFQHERRPHHKCDGMFYSESHDASRSMSWQQMKTEAMGYKLNNNSALERAKAHTFYNSMTIGTTWNQSSYYIFIEFNSDVNREKFNLTWFIWQVLSSRKRPLRQWKRWVEWQRHVMKWLIFMLAEEKRTFNRIIQAIKSPGCSTNHSI